MSSKPIFPIIREQAPVVNFFRQRAGLTSGVLTESQEQMASEFRIGMAESLGVPPEAIREDLVRKWIINWTRAFVKPEYWSESVPSVGDIRGLGQTIGEIVRSAIPIRERLNMLQPQAQPAQSEQPQREKSEPYFTDLHVA